MKYWNIDQINEADILSLVFQKRYNTLISAALALWGISLYNVKRMDISSYSREGTAEQNAAIA